MLKKIILTVLRISLGLVFVFSAFTKLYPIEILELSLVELGFINWSIAPYIARLFIAFEAIVGIFLILNIKIRLVIKAVIILLVLFTFYLLNIWYKDGENVDCGCFGEYLKLNTKESILKNVILLIPSFILLFTAKPFNWKFQKILIITIILIITSLPFILNVVGYEAYTNDEIVNKNIKLEVEKLGEFSFKNKTYNLEEGKKIVCFLSLSCSYCKLVARKLTIINEKIDNNLPIFYILGGSAEKLNQFWNESKSFQFPYLLLTPGEKNNETFFELSGPVLPSIYFINNGIVVKRFHFSDLEQSEVENFLKK